MSPQYVQMFYMLFSLFTSTQESVTLSHYTDDKTEAQCDLPEVTELEGGRAGMPTLF